LRQSLLGTALAALLPGVLVAVSPWETARPVVDHGGAVLNEPRVWLAAAVLFFYLPLEQTLAAWSGPYLIDLGHSPRLSAALTTGFWVAFLATRLAVGFFLGQDLLVISDVEPWIVLLLAAFTAIVLGNMLGAPAGRANGLAIILLGASLGPMFPTVVGLVYRLFPQGPATACGAVMAMAALGGALLPALAGVSEPRPGCAQAALRFPMALTLVLTTAALVLTLVQGV
jgi:fucose permease